MGSFLRAHLPALEAPKAAGIEIQQIFAVFSLACSDDAHLPTEAAASIYLAQTLCNWIWIGQEWCLGGGGNVCRCWGNAQTWGEEQPCPGGLGACGVELEASCAEQQLVPLIYILLFQLPAVLSVEELCYPSLLSALGLLTLAEPHMRTRGSGGGCVPTSLPMESTGTSAPGAELPSTWARGRWCCMLTGGCWGGISLLIAHRKWEHQDLSTVTAADPSAALGYAGFWFWAGQGVPLCCPPGQFGTQKRGLQETVLKAEGLLVALLLLTNRYSCLEIILQVF